MADSTTRVALVVAGGASLGAFNAGAALELVRSLEADAAGRIELDVLSGASAGSMVLAVLLRHLAAGQSLPALERALVACGVSGLGVDYLEADDPRQLLPDTERHDELGLLSSQPVRRLLRAYVEEVERAGPPSALLGEKVYLSFALTNLQGIDVPDPFDVALTSSGENPAADAVTSSYHDDRLRFLLLPEGAPQPVEASSGARVLGGAGADWQVVSAAALASGAFPGAWQPVRLERWREEYLAGWPAALADRERFAFSYADGGVLCNEPLTEAVRLAALRDADDPPGRRVFVLIDPNVTDHQSVLALEHESSWSWEPGSSGELVRRTYAGKLRAYLRHVVELLFRQARTKPALRRGDLGGDLAAITPLSVEPGLVLAGAFMANFGGFLDESWRRHDFDAGRFAARDVLGRCGRSRGPGLTAELPVLVADADPPPLARPPDPHSDGHPSYGDAAPAVRARLEEAVEGHSKQLSGSLGVPSVLGDVVGYALVQRLQQFVEQPQEETRSITARLLSVDEDAALAPAEGCSPARPIDWNGARVLETVILAQHRPREATPYRLSGPHVRGAESEEPRLELRKQALFGLRGEPERTVALNGAPSAWFAAAFERRLLVVRPGDQTLSPTDLTQLSSAPARA